MNTPLRPLVRILLLLGLLSPLAAQTIPPYATSYEATGGYTLGSLQGQDNWQVTQGSANIVNTLAAEGAQSVQLPASFPLAQITRAFGPPATGHITLLDFYVWPSAAGTVNYSTLVDAEGSSVGLVRLDAAGHILVFDGDGQGGGRWVVTGRTLSLYPGGQTTTWVRFTLRQDYLAKKWDLYVGTRMVAHDLGLRDNTKTHFSLFRLTAALQTNYLDDLYTGEENPLFIDADNDGLEDAWETTHGLDATLDDRNGDPDRDGLSNVAEYQLGTDPDRADTNADGIPDGWLVDRSLDPLGNLAATDPGSVGRTLLQSYQQNLSPWPTPPVSEGLRAWYRADAGVIQDVSNQVSQWTDLSGRGFHVWQTTPSRQPRWVASGPNGQPALRFDASAGMLLATNAPVDLNAGSSDLTVIAVVQAEAAQPASSTLLDLSWNGGPRGFHWWRGSEPANRFYLGWADVGLNSEQRTPGADAIAGRVQVFTAVKSGTSATDYLDGAAQQTRTVLAALHQPVARFAVGNTAADSTHGFHGQIAELLVYNRALTTAERATIETALRSRYINPDADADGLPDEWEDQQLGTRIYGGNDDPGNVGRTLLQSYQQGSSIWPAPLVGNGLRAWYRADLGVVRDAANQVSRWTDVSGHGFHVLQTIDPSRQPAWAANAVNGRPAVSYDASARMTLETSSPADLAAGSNDLTLIAVIQPDPVQPAASTLLDLGRYSGPYGLHWWQEGATANRYYLGWSDPQNDSELRSPGLTASAGRVQVLTVLKSGGSATDYLDGTAQGANTWSATSLRAPASRLALGNTAGFPTRSFHGQIAELLVYNRALSETERTTIENQLTGKYVATTTPVTFSLDRTSFTYTGGAQGPRVVASDPAATFTTGGTLSATAVGTYTATATATGNYTGGNDALAWTINKGDQAITFPDPGPQVYGGTPLTLTATASSGLPVSYTVTGPATLNGNTITFTSTGTVTLTANQPGDANWNPAASVSRTFTVGLAFNNFDFEQGWVGWTLSGSGAQVEPYVPYGGLPAQGNRAYSSARGSGSPGIELNQTNRLTSLPFTLPAGTTRFSAQLAGGSGYNGQDLHVQLVNAATGAEIARLYRTGNGSAWELRVATFTLAAAAQVQLHIVDNRAFDNGYDYLAVDDIRLETLPTSFTNFDFEQGASGWLPQLGNGGQIASTVSDDQLPIQGTQAYQSAPGSGVVTTTDAARTNQLWSGTFLVTAGDKLFSGQLFAAADSALYVALIEAATGREICRISKWNSGPTWERRGASFTLTADTLAYMVIVDASGTGYFAVDDLTITPYTFDNFDFEQGWVGWTLSGSGAQVEPYVPYGGLPAQGNRAYSSARGSGSPGIELNQTNRLTSLPFTLPAGTTRFSAQLAGGSGYNGQDLHVQLVNAATGAEIARLYRTGNGSAWELRVATFTLAAAAQVQLHIVDNRAFDNGYDYLAVDDIRLGP